jgi:hypothetical protein
MLGKKIAPVWPFLDGLSLLTREYHLSLYAKDMSILGERTFDQLSGDGQDTYPKEQLSTRTLFRYHCALGACTLGSAAILAASEAGETPALPGETTQEFLSRYLAADLQRLQAIEALHKEFIDRRLAHYDKATRLGTLPTMQELYGAVGDVEKMVIKYHLLLKAETVRLLPITQYDWKAIFRSPWITENP